MNIKMFGKAEEKQKNRKNVKATIEMVSRSK